MPDWPRDNAFSCANMLRASRLAVAVVCLTVACAAADTPSIAARPNPSASIVLDGRLSEPAWGDAPALVLTQQSPNPGGENPYRTEVRIVVGADRLYFAFSCHDPQPHRIAVHSMARDADMS